MTTADAGLDALAELVEDGDVVVLSGAGLSTESGIPDYRGPRGAVLRRHAPMTFQAFTGDVDARRRYWARSHLGWGRIRAAHPNDGHRAVAAWESEGWILGTITQNVDGLHAAAGSKRVVDLHGRLDRVVCLDCRDLTSRQELDDRLAAANAEWQGAVRRWNPDGDVDLDDDHLATFTVVPCARCGGVLKPDVVYFGESVPRDRVDQCYAWVDGARAMIVLGSSLHVYSGRRFVMRAAERGIPIAIVNEGPTRGDDVCTIRIDAPLGATLVDIRRRLPVPSS